MRKAAKPHTETDCGLQQGVIEDEGRCYRIEGFYREALGC